MIRFIILWVIVNLLFVAKAKAQPDTWNLIDSPYNVTDYIGSGAILYYSENLDLLIVNGKRTIGELDEETGEFIPELTHFYPVYDGDNWSYLSICENSQFSIFHSITDYNGGVVTTGPACNAELGEFEGLSFYQNGVWTQLGAVEGSVNVLKTFNDTLYAAGFFTGIGGDEVQYLAKYDGNNWISAFQIMPEFIGTGVAISTIDYFQSEWYIGGNWQSEEGSKFLVLREGEWQPVVGETTNMLSGTVSTTAVYNDELYVGGYIQKNGNVGHGLQKWDGNNWFEVGESLQSQSMDFDMPIQVQQLLVHNDALYARGNFYFASGNYVKYLARWDGSQWCGLQTFQVEFMPYYMASFNGTLISQMQVNQVGLGYFNHDDASFYPCSEVFTGFDDESQVVFSLLPNPCTDHFYLEFQNESHQPRNLVLYSITGQRVKTQALSGGSRHTVDVSGLDAGMYVVHIMDGQNVVSTTKLVVQGR